MATSPPERSEKRTSWAPVIFWCSLLGLVALLHDPHGYRELLEKTGLGISPRVFLITLWGVFVPIGLIAYFVSLRVPRKPTRGKLPATWALIEQSVTVGMAGYAPLAPGTLGALTALPIGFAVADLSWSLRLSAVAGVTVAAVWLVHRYVKHTLDDDPQEVVLDELVGCLIALVFVPATIAWAAAAFALFRLFDILKPWPIGPVDRRLKGGIGVVGDDVLAGLIAGLLLTGIRQIGIASGLWG